MEIPYTILITQARLGSTRLPGKVLKKICGKSLLEIHLSRLQKCKNVDLILVATTSNPNDDLVVREVEKIGIPCFRGSEDDVLDRYYKAARNYKPAWVVRVTSDCPLIDPKLVDQIIEFAKENQVDYCSNTMIEEYPDGQDAEVFKFSALQKAWEESKLSSEREHVTPFIRNNSGSKGLQLFSSINFPSPANYSEIRMTVDEPQDFTLVEKLIEAIGTDQNWITYTNYIIQNDLQKFNQHIIRNEGLLKSIKQDNNG